MGRGMGLVKPISLISQMGLICLIAHFVVFLNS